MSVSYRCSYFLCILLQPCENGVDVRWHVLLAALAQIHESIVISELMQRFPDIGLVLVNSLDHGNLVGDILNVHEGRRRNLEGSQEPVI